MTQDPPRVWLTIREACAAAHVTRRTIYNWLSAGLLVTTRVAGGPQRIAADSLFLGVTMGGLKWKGDRTDLEDHRADPPAVWQGGDGVDGPRNTENRGTMRPLAIFTNPDDASVELRHDSGQTFPSVLGEADGRPAHLIELPESLPEGHGAWIVIDWEGQKLEQHGALYLKGSPRAQFHADVFNKPF